MTCNSVYDYSTILGQIRDSDFFEKFKNQAVQRLQLIQYYLEKQLGFSYHFKNFKHNARTLIISKRNWPFPFNVSEYFQSLANNQQHVKRHKFLTRSKLSTIQRITVKMKLEDLSLTWWKSKTFEAILEIYKHPVTVTRKAKQNNLFK